MRKVLLIAFFPLMALISGCAAYGKGHHGNCGCPNFGEHKVKQVNMDQVSVSAKQDKQLQ